VLKCFLEFILIAILIFSNSLFVIAVGLAALIYKYKKWLPPTAKGQLSTAHKSNKPVITPLLYVLFS